MSKHILYFCEIKWLANWNAVLPAIDFSIRYGTAAIGASAVCFLIRPLLHDFFILFWYITLIFVQVFQIWSQALIRSPRYVHYRLWIFHFVVVLGGFHVSKYPHIGCWSINPYNDNVIKWKFFVALLTNCAGNSTVADEFPSQRYSKAKLWCFFDAD